MVRAMSRLDPHSYNDDRQPEIARLDWQVRVDFPSRTLDCVAGLELAKPGEGPLDLDTRELRITRVTDGNDRPIPFTLAPAEPILGARLRLELPAGTERVRIHYTTAPNASALQWLTPAQTAGGRQPFLFTQCQAIHARSIVPIQDTPRIRIRYRARIEVPAGLRSLMAARETDGGWEMPQPIPPYLLAFAVGELEARELGPRSRVWAEPSVVDKAAWEFSNVDAMLTTAEQLFGAYDWERFDLLVMPPSFPYGGMENPRLTFLTPTLLAGDRSLVSVVAHELAHSWTGNLVSNASAEHFWLNEGFTVFAERRIVEALYGGDVCAMQAALGRRDLDDALQRFSKTPELTKLETRLQGVDPDEVFSEVPYEKGYLFLRALEETVGRSAFDRFLQSYVRTFRFRAITTADFAALVEAELPGALARAGGEAWMHAPGLPASAPSPRSDRLDRIAQILQRAGGPTDAEAGAFTPTEWQLYLEGLPHPQARAFCEELDRRFQLTRSGNYEVLVSWLQLAIESGHEPALPRAEEVLGRVGRMKYLKPLYSTLAKNPSTRALATRCFQRFRDGYHPIAQQVIEGLLA
jgi:aminopeptidase N